MPSIWTSHTRIAITYTNRYVLRELAGTFDVEIVYMAKLKRKPETLKRSEIVTVRLDHRLKYLAEIAARKQRRTLSGYVEWAVEQSLKLVLLTEANAQHTSISVEDAERELGLWDVDEAERVATLAFNYPELLSYEEQLIWRTVRDFGPVWRGKYSGPNQEFVWNIEETTLLRHLLRENWELLKGVALGDIPPERLPKWEKSKPAKPIDDDIPF